MSGEIPPTTISIHIPPQLQHLAIPLRKWLDENPSFDSLVVGAYIFSAAQSSSSSLSNLLLVQRSMTDAFPGLWEIPGGSSDFEDPTILHSVAREVFEETGLRLTRFIRQTGSATFETSGKDGVKKWCKLGFEIEVQEDHQTCTTDSLHALLEHTHIGENGDEPDDSKSASRSADASAIVSKPCSRIVLDPAEHQAYKWVSEEEILKKGTFVPDPAVAKHPESSSTDGDHIVFVSADSLGMTLEAFHMHDKGEQIYRSGSSEIAVKPSTPTNHREKAEKALRYYRYKLQKTFLSRDRLPADEELDATSSFLTALENEFPDPEASVLLSTKIHKVLKAMYRLPNIPKDEEYQFKKRSMELLVKYHKIIQESRSASSTMEV